MLEQELSVSLSGVSSAHYIRLTRSLLIAVPTDSDIPVAGLCVDQSRLIVLWSTSYLLPLSGYTHLDGSLTHWEQHGLYRSMSVAYHAHSTGSTIQLAITLNQTQHRKHGQRYGKPTLHLRCLHTSQEMGLNSSFSIRVKH